MAPLADVNGYKAFWHPYDGYNLPYRLLYPYDYDPEQSYPLIVFTHGSEECGTNNTSQINWSIAQAFYGGTTPSASFSTWPCFVICPQAPAVDHYSNPATYSFEAQFHSGYNQGRAYSWYVAAVLDLIAEIQQTGFHFYNEADLTGEDETVSDCNINANKIYCMGASLGGLACYSFAKEGRDVWAGIVAAKAFNCRTPHTDYYRVASDDYDYETYLRCYWEFERIIHIPFMHIDYQDDGMYATMQGINYVRNKVYTQVYGDGGNTGRFVSITGGSHENLGDFLSIFDPNNKIPYPLSSEQQYGATGQNPMDWLFGLSKRTTRPDPYPDEEETYYPERSYAVISNDTVANSVYTGQRTTVSCDKTKDVKVRVAGVDADVTFTDGYYTHVQGGVNCFCLRDRGVVGQVDKLNTNNGVMLL